MGIEIAEPVIAPFFAAGAVLLVDTSLAALVDAADAEGFTVIAFSGTRIGDAGTLVALEALGLPVAPIFVVHRPGSPMAAALSEFARGARLPRPPKACAVSVAESRLGWPARGKIRRFLRGSALALLKQRTDLIRQREAEVQALRQVIADQNGRLGRLSDALILGGIGDGEFSLPLGSSLVRVSGTLATVATPLYGIESLRLRRTSPKIGTVRVAFTLDGREVDQREADFGGEDTLDLVVPRDLAALRDSVEISVQPLRADTTGVGPGAIGSVLFRMDRKPEGASAVVSRSATTLRGPVAATTLQAGPSSLDLLQGTILEEGSSVRITGRLQGGGPPPDVVLVLADAGGGPAPADEFPARIDGSDLRLEGTVAQRGRYDVSLRIAGGGTGRIAWSQVSVASAQPAPPVAFASARFASLAGAMSYCDGPAEEMALNAAQGFASIAASDGAHYLQTHPIAGRLSGARLPRLIPYGTSFAWIDVENAHPSASPCEFIAVITREVLTDPVGGWLDALQLPAYRGYSIIERPEAIVARRILVGGSAAVFRLELTEPLRYDGTLYCLVRPTTENVSYGWCRWNRIVVGVTASERLNR